MIAWVCPDCGRRYAYEIDLCMACRSQVEETNPSRGAVVAVTRVDTPSRGHEDVPYWTALVRSTHGLQAIVKFDHAVDVGEPIVFEPAERAASLARVGVIGTGVMGRGLAELLLSRGHQVIWCGRTTEALDDAKARLLERLARVMDSAEVRVAESRIAVSAKYEVLGECDVVIEAVVEETAPKQAVLREAERHMRDDAILATNTSGLSLDELSAELHRPHLFGALHFFNPATRMRLVETALCARTSQQTGDYLDAFSRSLGKIPVRVSATPAFAVNRALMPLLNEAVRELEDGVASAEHIDEAIRLGLNHPMGPLALADLIGLDVVVRIMDNLVQRTGDSTYAPRPLLMRLVAEGKLGRKTKEGFYDY